MCLCITARQGIPHHRIHLSLLSGEGKSCHLYKAPPSLPWQPIRGFSIAPRSLHTAPRGSLQRLKMALRYREKKIPGHGCSRWHESQTDFAKPWLATRASFCRWVCSVWRGCEGRLGAMGWLDREHWQRCKENKDTEMKLQPNWTTCSNSRREFRD